jgi:hypothetical protein
MSHHRVSSVPAKGHHYNEWKTASEDGYVEGKEHESVMQVIEDPKAT